MDKEVSVTLYLIRCGATPYLGNVSYPWVNVLRRKQKRPKRAHNNKCAGEMASD